MAIGVLAMRNARREDEARASLARQSGRLRRAEQDLATVLRDTVDRQEAERKRVALELHDSLGQHVAVLHFGLDRLRADCEGEPATHGRIDGLKSTATALSHEISRIATELRPLGIDELGLANAIRSHARAIDERTGLRFDLHLPNLPVVLPPSLEDTLFRAMQEAVSNVVRHADATRVSIVLELDEGTVRLIVEDNGKGFEWPVSSDNNGRRPLGLLGMRERVALAGGEVVVETRAGGGTTIFITIPLSEIDDVEESDSRAPGGRSSDHPIIRSSVRA
jgi:signal transduction histidine kinase